MKTKKEVTIAIIVAILMIIICFVIYLVNTNTQKETELNIKAYKLYEVENSENDHAYKECRLSTEDKLSIKKEFKRVASISESKAVVGKTIEGSYKVVIDDNYIAFDNTEDKLVYNGNKNMLFNISTSIYKTVIDACN